MEVELSPSAQNFALTTTEDDVPDKLDLKIKKIVEREGFMKSKIEKRCISTNGGNYLGVLYEVDVKGKTKDGEKTLNIFVKNIIHSENMKVLEVSDVYNTEIFAYKELSKVFNELQEEANVPEEERYKMVKVYDESDTDAIIMENVTKKGFGTWNRMDLATLDYVEFSFKTLAKFNALSLVLKEKKPEFFEKKLKHRRYPLVFGDDWNAMVKNCQDSTLPHVDEEYRERVKKFYEGLADKFEEYVKDDSVRVCLCHGDYRPNNIMSKIQEGKVQDMIPVDYQLVNYGSPVFDILYFTYLCTDREFRTAHMENLKDLYFDTLRQFLGYFELDVDVVYPREQFDKVFKEKLEFGLMSALVFLPFVLAAEDNVPDVTEDFVNKTFDVEDAYKYRIRDIIEEFVEWGYL